MNLDELFDQAARVAEPGLPADVLGGVRRAQAQRRRRQLIAVPVACVVIAAGVLVPTVLSSGDRRDPRDRRRLRRPRVRAHPATHHSATHHSSTHDSPDDA